MKRVVKAMSDIEGLSRLAFESFCRHSDASRDVIIVSKDELTAIMKIVTADICLEIISRLEKQ